MPFFICKYIDEFFPENLVQVYIIYFGEHKSGGKTIQEIEDSHHSYLLSVKSNEKDARDSLLYNYKNSINGFAALLTADEASKLSGTCLLYICLFMHQISVNLFALIHFLNNIW